MNTIAKDISIGLSLDNENLSSPDVLVNRNAVLAVFKSAKQEGGAWIIPAGTGRVAVLAKKKTSGRSLCTIFAAEAFAAGASYKAVEDKYAGENAAGSEADRRLVLRLRNWASRSHEVQTGRAAKRPPQEEEVCSNECLSRCWPRSCSVWRCPAAWFRPPGPPGRERKISVFVSSPGIPVPCLSLCWPVRIRICIT